MALPGANVFLLSMEAKISLIFFMTICVGNQTLRDALILEREKYRVNAEKEKETDTRGTRMTKSQGTFQQIQD